MHRTNELYHFGIFMHCENYIRELPYLGIDMFNNMYNCIFCQVSQIALFPYHPARASWVSIHKFLGSFIHMYPVQRHKSSIIVFGITHITQIYSKAGSAIIQLQYKAKIRVCYSRFLFHTKTSVSLHLLFANLFGHAPWANTKR